jgi:hypothetical protein
MQRCMDEKIRPLRFAGFGRSTTQQTFVQRISTVRAHARETSTPGFGTPAGSAILVPWFLVSSPSLDASSGRLVAPTAPPATGPTTPTAPVRPGTTTTTQAPPTPPTQGPTPPTPPTLPGQTPPAPAGGTRPWWEE